ncbi:DUF4236 domain-containing protein [Geodermatophilus sp. SYSU D00697]
MGLRVGTSLRAGPFRFNISSSGLGVSAGVPGFRVGTGPRGNYVRVGGNGISYQATLGGSATRRQTGSRSPNAGSTSPAGGAATAVLLEDTTGTSVQQLVATGSDDLVDQLNASASRQPLAVWVGLTALIIAITLGAVGLVVLLLALPLVIWLGLRDRARRTVVAFYDVQDAPAAWYEQLVAAATELSRSKGMWRITAAGAVSNTHQHKVNAGASRVVARRTAKMDLSRPPRLTTNVSVPTITVGGASLSFLPDRILVRDGRRFSDVGYDSLQVSAAPTRFIEDSAVPADAQQVDTTWRYVNVKGGPDRRYKNNRQLPVLLYGDLRFTSSSRLQWDLKVSHLSNTLNLAAILAAVPRESLRLTAKPGPGPASAPAPSVPTDATSAFGTSSTNSSASLRAAAEPITRSLPLPSPRPVPPQPPMTPRAPAALTPLVLGGDGRVEVVGESHYQDALRHAASGRAAATLENAIRVQATLVPEPENVHDSHAVRVDVDGRTVGYLSRALARTYQPVLLELRRRGQVGSCSARIMGGGGRSYGIHLHLSAPGLLQPANQPAGLTLWEAARHVTVTGEERHQDVLSALTPHHTADGMFPVFASLGVCQIATGKYAGQSTVEVRINGQRVGQLTKAQADKYLPMVEVDLAVGQQPGCHAYVTRTADKGLQVTALLPRV